MVSLKATLAGFGAVAALLLQPCAALPYSAGLEPSQSPNYENIKLLKRADARDFYLRVMPLGASITAGEHGPEDDTQMNGYRKFLRDKLRLRGWKVNMVGSFNRGLMKDNDHEGISGQRVSEVTARTKRATHTWLPNVVLINAGTNDATQNGRHEPVDGTGLRMKELIETIFSEVPHAVVVLSTLVPNGINQGNVDKVNAEYRDLYYRHFRSFVTLDEHGNEVTPFKVVLADMADGFITSGDIKPHPDLTHPTIPGNMKMAAVWDWAIDQANGKGWLSEPSPSGLFEDSEGTTTCRKEYGSGNQDVRSGRQVLHAANSVIRDDGTYRHQSVPRNDREVTNLGRSKGTRVWFAQLVNVYNAPKGGERDELVWGWKVERRTLKFRLNMGDGNFAEEHDIDVKDDYIRDGCPIEAIQWGDVNGDGLDDFICIAENGEMFVSLNTGGNPPTFRALGSYKTPERGLGRAHVRLGDIDGDGRLDYCVIPASGDIFCWRNGGIGERAAYWQNMGSGGPVFTAKGMGDIRGVRFVDINGDGRSDWTWMDEHGRVTTWINQRGSDKGMIPRWLDAGVTHQGMGTNIGIDRHQIAFGRIFGDNGRADYIHYWESCTLSYCSRRFVPYENLGSGGKFQKGDGIYWGDMTGTGVDDYIWISPDSDNGNAEAWIFLNKNTREQSDFYATSAWSTPISLKTGLNRRALHIGDWDGDGKDDIIGIIDRNTGALRVWHSRWDGSRFNWDVRDIPNSARCNQGWGLGYFDNGAHFADISGSGRVDYICMEPSGRATAWLRDEHGGWFNAGQVKYHEDLDRANFQFADVNGDGRADLVWTDKFNGDANVWYNKRQAAEHERGNLGGSLFEWERPIKAFLGSSRGPNMHFPNLGGQGRADMVGTNPTTGHVSLGLVQLLPCGRR
ncbi:hypothetical protein SODALDRAFT_105063 [Sodiomyces alkalinus F11]|uniref:SGNH hydrolase-type esterase domain-containing protein n=1 Tax=Sodiomyces alkalinus (strain CBS 110278 / VKM F-3762 / F11) TaxID=1314773 RepID=A0A3N2Q202_SODAK|nr:hypothetical protein SODALDRAFT_105063 [Sodiomyces alkalinus F11]ROT40793.1 hypothetical protein SODALDRAFT_105063 [Sodiomyces alkalinus F11]